MEKKYKDQVLAQNTEVLKLYNYSTMKWATLTSSRFAVTRSICSTRG